MTLTVSVILCNKEINERNSSIKILVSGGCWTTERSREIERLFGVLTKTAEDGGQGLPERAAVKRIAAELGVSAVTVSVNLPYQSVVYKLEKKSKNAVRCGRYRKRKKAEGQCFDGGTKG